MARSVKQAGRDRYAELPVAPMTVDEGAAAIETAARMVCPCAAAPLMRVVRMTLKDVAAGARRGGRSRR